MKKVLFLLFTLAIPVAIFLFLKIFGSNEFDVPVLFENGISDCEESSTVHTVPPVEYIGETVKNLNDQNHEEFMVFLYVDNGVNINKVLRELVRIQDAFYEVGAPKFILLSHQEFFDSDGLKSLTKNLGLKEENHIVVFMAGDSLMDFLRCGIGLSEGQEDHLVLVDTKRKVRGIYDTFDLEQTDQLILELKILKKMM